MACCKSKSDFSHGYRNINVVSTFKMYIKDSVRGFEKQKTKKFSLFTLFDIEYESNLNIMCDKGTLKTL